MIEVWYLLPVFLIGFVIGVFLAALIYVHRDDDP